MARPAGTGILWGAAALTTLCALPALIGDWVYDDHMLVDSPMFDDAADLLAVFSRDSFDYLPDSTSTTSGVTYRPLSVATLIATNLLGGATPLLHHLVSLLLHLGTFAALAALCLLRFPDRPSGLACAPALVFVLHPALTEAYQWISGRHDLLAGLSLASIAWALAREERAVAAQRRGLSVTVVGVAALVGALSKETFAPAALCLLGAHALRPGPPGGGLPRRRLVASVAILALALLVSGVLRSHAAGDAPATRGALDILREPAFYARLPGLLGTGVQTLLWPLARPMRNLAWELASGPGVVQLAWLVSALGGWLWLCLRGYWRAAVLVAGAAATLAPTASIADIFWLGFDRYLYLPAILLVVAASSLPLSPVRSDSPAPPPPPPPPPLRPVFAAATAGLGLWLASGCWISAGFYRDDASFVAAMMRHRPEDPSGFIVAAGITPAAQVEDGMRAYMGSLATRELPVALVREALRVQHHMGLHDALQRTLEDALHRFAGNQALAFDLFELRGAQRRFEEALGMATRLLADRYYCVPAQATLRRWQGWNVMADPERARTAELLRAHPCP